MSAYQIQTLKALWESGPRYYLDFRDAEWDALCGLAEKKLVEGWPFIGVSEAGLLDLFHRAMSVKPIARAA